jgi:hypothetical protein
MMKRDRGLFSGRVPAPVLLKAPKNSSVNRQQIVPSRIARLLRREPPAAATSPQQPQPKKSGCKRGPKCCGSGLRRNQQPNSRSSRALGRIGDPGSAPTSHPASRYSGKDASAGLTISRFGPPLPPRVPGATLQASPDGREIVGSSGPGHVSSYVGRTALTAAGRCLPLRGRWQLARLQVVGAPAGRRFIPATSSRSAPRPSSSSKN